VRVVVVEVAERARARAREKGGRKVG
jgi:hypothetical protein